MGYYKIVSKKELLEHLQGLPIPIIEALKQKPFKYAVIYVREFWYPNIVSFHKNKKRALEKFEKMKKKYGNRLP